VRYPPHGLGFRVWGLGLGAARALRGALPPVDLRAVCFVRAILLSGGAMGADAPFMRKSGEWLQRLCFPKEEKHLSVNSPDGPATFSPPRDPGPQKWRKGHRFSFLDQSRVEGSVCFLIQLYSCVGLVMFFTTVSTGDMRPSRMSAKHRYNGSRPKRARVWVTLRSKGCAMGTRVPNL
jgi:hypothetical protein